MGNERRCPDGGRCWHNCGENCSCWRVNHAAPFTGEYPGDDWPDDVKADNPPEGCTPCVEDLFC
jgi:hypothetical protein